MTDFFTEGPIDPRIYKELATDMWREAVSYLPIKDVLKLPNLCKYFNNEVVWHPHSGRLMWGEMGNINEKVFKVSKLWRGENAPTHPALIRACVKGAKITHVKALLNGGANVNAVDCYSQTALYWASYGGYEGIVRVLLEANADPNIISKSDTRTPLMVASCYGYAGVVTTLTTHGADLNYADNDGCTALMWASYRSHVDVARILVNARADINLRNNDGETALDIALHHEIIRILKETQLEEA